jgi:hypothetical protein
MGYLALALFFLCCMPGVFSIGYLRGVADTETRWREAVGRSCSPNCRRYPNAGEQ